MILSSLLRDDWVELTLGCSLLWHYLVLCQRRPAPSTATTASQKHSSNAAVGPLLFLQTVQWKSSIFSFLYANLLYRSCK